MLTLIKKKRCGKIKGRVFANGRKQRRYTKKEEVSSPTVQLQSILTSLAIDAKENRYVAIADVAGAYLQTIMTDFVIIAKLTGSSVKIMCEVMSSFEGYVIKEQNKDVLYMRLHKALYGCMQSALLWYRTFKERLEGMGFKINAYDPCVANKEVIMGPRAPSFGTWTIVKFLIRKRKWLIM